MDKITMKSYLHDSNEKSFPTISLLLTRVILIRVDMLYLCLLVLLSEGEHVSSTKPCNLAQMTLDELYNKSHEGFMLSKCQKRPQLV